MAASASPRLDNSFGAVLVGNSVGLIIYGMTLLQCYRYFRLYPGDSYKMKVLVFAFMMLETLHIIETTHTCYYYLVSNYCESAKLGIGVWSIRILTPTNGAIVFMAQMFYARRLHLLKSCNGVLVIIMVSLSLIALGFTITAAVEGFLQVSFRAWRHVVWIDVVAVAVNLMVDLMLSITLVLFLHRSRSGLRRSNSLVDLLVAYTVNTCVLVSVMNILVLTSIIAWPSTLIYVGISIPTARTYANAVLAVLNCRKSLGELANETCDLGMFSSELNGMQFNNCDVVDSAETHLDSLPGHSIRVGLCTIDSEDAQLAPKGASGDCSTRVKGNT